MCRCIRIAMSLNLHQQHPSLLCPDSHGVACVGAGLLCDAERHPGQCAGCAADAALQRNANQECEGAFVPLLIPYSTSTGHSTPELSSGLLNHWRVLPAPHNGKGLPI